MAREFGFNRSGLPEGKIDDPAPAGVRPVVLAVGQDVRAVAPGVLEGVCEYRKPVEGAIFVDPTSERGDRGRKRVRGWIARHYRRVSRAKQGCRIRVCGRPVKAPWRNPIEPKWMHGKRAVVEPDRRLTAEELRQRVCDHDGCKLHPSLPKPQP